MRQIILASQSPRRFDLLTQMGVEFTVIPSNFEEHLDDSRRPSEVAIELALGKAKDVAVQHPDAIVIGADTIVTIDGKQLGKPSDATDAKEMLALLADKPNQVTTGMAVICKSEGVELTTAETATVYFKPFDEVAVDEYIATGDPLDKAGAYGIQSGASVLIDRIEGDYSAIIGLPTKQLAVLLAELGVTATPVLLVSPA